MNTMDLKLNREMLSMTRTILDASCEQAVEKDFLLPDYYPDIFRVLKCVIKPTVQSHSINGGKLSFDMAVLIRVDRPHFSTLLENFIVRTPYWPRYGVSLIP